MRCPFRIRPSSTLSSSRQFQKGIKCVWQCALFSGQSGDMISHNACRVLSFDVSVRIPTTHDGRSTQNQRYISKPQQCDSARCGHSGRQHGRFLHKRHRRLSRNGSTCRGCGKANHWIKMCMAGAKDTRTRRPTRPVMSKKQGIPALENSKDTDNQSELYFDQLEINTL